MHLTGCREHVTFFTFTCNTPSAAAGTINVNGLTYHFINLLHGGTTPGVKFTGVNATIECTELSKKTITGSVVGHLESASCNTGTTTHTVDLAQSSTGNQKYKQITTTGTETDLIANNDTGGSYTTMALISTLTIHWNHVATLTC